MFKQTASAEAYHSNGLKAVNVQAVTQRSKFKW